MKLNKTCVGYVILSLLCLTLIGSAVFVVPKTMAYLTAQGGDKSNKFTIGNVLLNVNEDFNPPNHVGVGAVSFKKTIRLTNNGTIPAYLRCSVMFSDYNVEEISKVSTDNGSTWKTLAQLKSNPPSGWAYQSTGVLSGYFYYTSPVQPGRSTPALITHVQTNFANKTADTNTSINYTPRDFDIFVYGEAIQQMKLNGAGKNTSYSTAWTEFLNMK